MNLNYKWTKKPGGISEDHWIDLISQVDTITLPDDSKIPCWWYEAAVKQDGCIHFKMAFNEPFDEKQLNNSDSFEYFHICNIDELILLLIKLRQAARQYFGNDWDK